LVSRAGISLFPYHHQRWLRTVRLPAWRMACRRWDAYYQQLCWHAFNNFFFRGLDTKRRGLHLAFTSCGTRGCPVWLTRGRFQTFSARVAYAAFLAFCPAAHAVLFGTERFFCLSSNISDVVIVRRGISFLLF